MFYVYIIRSVETEILYKGFTTQPQQRLLEHNQGKSHYTKNKGPWEMAYLEEFITKREALIREKQIKRYNRSQLVSLILDKKNILYK